MESLYTNIAHDDGLKALQHFLMNRHTGSLPPSEFIIQLTEWTLKNNVFLFQDLLYIQVQGTAMGACFAPNYTNLFFRFMGKGFCLYKQLQ